MNPSPSFYISRLLPTAIVTVLLTAGCLTSDEPFMLGTDVVQDSSLIGHYRGQANGLEGSWQIEQRSEGDMGYLVTYNYGKNCSMRFMGFLFNAGTNRFLNLMSVPNKLDCQDGHRDVPSTMEVLQSLMWRPAHMVVRVLAHTNGPAFSIMTHEAFNEARRLAPDLLVITPPNIDAPKMIGGTAKQHAFLVEHGGNTNLFPAEPQLARYDPPPEPEPVNFEIDPTDPRWIKLLSEWEAEHRQKLEERRKRREGQ